MVSAAGKIGVVGLRGFELGFQALESGFRRLLLAGDGGLDGRGGGGNDAGGERGGKGGGRQSGDRGGGECRGQGGSLERRP